MSPRLRTPKPRYIEVHNPEGEVVRVPVGQVADVRHGHGGSWLAYPDALDGGIAVLEPPTQVRALLTAEELRYAASLLYLDDDERWSPWPGAQELGRLRSHLRGLADGYEKRGRPLGWS